MRSNLSEAIKGSHGMPIGIMRENSILLKLLKNRTLSRDMLIQAMAVYDIFAMAITGVVSKVVYIHEYPDDYDLYFIGYNAIILIGVFIFIFIARQRGEYHPSKINNITWQFGSLMSICIGTFAFIFVVLFFLKASEQFSRVWFAIWGLSFMGLLLLGRAFFAVQVRHLLKAGSLRHAVALIGGGPQYRLLRDRVGSDDQQFKIVRDVEISNFQESDKIFKDQLSQFVRDLQLTAVDEILISVPAAEGKMLQAIVRQAQLLPADIRVLPDLGGADIQMMHLTQTGPFQLITTVSKPIAGWSVFAKFAEDYCIASLALILALPAMLLIALLIKLDSQGPVFFRQRRHGYNHKVIEVLKFRTMTVLDDGDVIKQATKNDARITRIGRILRRTSLDELPQLINVLRGEMSIVGPRPHALAHNTYYGELIENYANRHRVKPGITGWAQVHGFRGETQNAAMMAERVKYDLEYIERWSLWLDFKIIIMTPFFGLFRNGAY